MYLPEQTVCLLNDSFPPLIDGVSNTVVNYAQEICRKGGRPMVVTPNHPEARDEGFSYPVVRYPSIDIREYIGYMAGVPFSPEAMSQISREKIGILHSHCPIVSTLLARQLRSVVDAPLVLTYHTKFDIEIDHLFRSRLLQKESKKALVQNIHACDEVWVVSKGAGENLAQLGYTGDYIIMPNGVDMPLGAPSDDQIQEATKDYDLPEGVPVFLFVGRMRWYKGQRIILEALGKLKCQAVDFRMVFVGDGSDREEMIRCAAELGIANKCIFTGAIGQRQQLRAWYARADLFLFPSTFDTNGLVVREAAANSVASVLIRDSCAAEGITHERNGFLIEENPDSLLACLTELTQHPQAMAQAGALAAQEIYISWESAVQAALDRYEVVIDRYRSGLYPPRREPMDTLFHANGALMEELARLVELRSQMQRRIRIPSSRHLQPGQSRPEDPQAIQEYTVYSRQNETE